jgi:hypothetical protein
MKTQGAGEVQHPIASEWRCLINFGHDTFPSEKYFCESEYSYFGSGNPVKTRYKFIG